MTEQTPAYSAPAGAPVARKTNVLAIVSLVLSILSFNVIAIILGIIALNQIKKTGEAGRGLALAGIIIGAVTFVIWLIVVIVLVATASTMSYTTTTY
ncbi:DUF4190 domain-containing protein [Herbiconiux solani]|uniref:DUF4190 domain-containing protein n=1 Tax=Herbiconiux solani TaxID=661329 RepID=UPI0008260B62|nr:DUF4190 domain-containing protein [Herbiconiux solani]